MRKYGTALVFLFAASCLASPQKPKASKFLPPRESHGMTISGCGCDKAHISDSPSTSKDVSYWSLTVWAQYGKDHKRYWEKMYGNYEVTVKRTFHSDGESAGSGAAIGAYGTRDYDFAPMDKACAEWAKQVESTLKIDSNAGEKPKE